MSGTHDKHVIEAAGKCRVVVRNGKVTEVGLPVIRHCPLAKRFAVPVNEMTHDEIAQNIQNRIDSFGMCTPEREIYSSLDFATFGATELICSGIRKKLTDCAVIACDGAGTVIVTDPAMVQGIGGLMSGLVQTCTYPELISRIEKGGGIVLDKQTGSLNSPEGVKRAVDAGFRAPSVTVANSDDAVAVRNLAPESVIIGVHLTGISEEETQKMGKVCDIMTSCASAAVRKVCGKNAVMQAGKSIPVFGMTENGKELLIARISEIKSPLIVKSATLPVMAESMPEPLV